MFWFPRDPGPGRAVCLLYDMLRGERDDSDPKPLKDLKHVKVRVLTIRLDATLARQIIKNGNSPHLRLDCDQQRSIRHSFLTLIRDTVAAAAAAAAAAVAQST